MSKYPASESEPESLRQMHAMMAKGNKPAPQIADPTSIAVERIFHIYMDFKNKVLLGDKQPETLLAALIEGRERTAKEVAHLSLRADALAKWDKMLAMLEGGGTIQI